MLQKNAAFYSTVSDAKSQVDLLVSLFCLTVLFSAFWSTYSLFVQPTPRAFLIVATLGPVAARLLYLAGLPELPCIRRLYAEFSSRFDSTFWQHYTAKSPPGNREEILLWRLLGGWGVGVWERR